MHWNYFVFLFNCTRDQSTRTHTLKIREHSCFGMLCKIPAAPHGAVHKWSSLKGDDVVEGTGGLLQFQPFFWVDPNKVCLVSVHNCDDTTWCGGDISTIDEITATSKKDFFGQKGGEPAKSNLPLYIVCCPLHCQLSRICFDILCSVLFRKVSFAPSQVPFFQIFCTQGSLMTPICVSLCRAGKMAV